MGGLGGWPVHAPSPTGDGISPLPLAGQRLLLDLPVSLVPKPDLMRRQSARDPGAQLGDPGPQLGEGIPLGTGIQMSGEKQQDRSWGCLSGGSTR